MSWNNSTLSVDEKRLQMLGLKLEVFKRDDNKDFRIVQNLTKGESHFTQFHGVRSHLVLAAGKLGTEQSLCPIQKSTIIKNMDQQLKPAQKVVDVVCRPYGKNCLTTLRYNVDKTECSHAQVRIFQRTRRERNFNKLFMWTINKVSLYI